MLFSRVARYRIGLIYTIFDMPYSKTSVRVARDRTKLKVSGPLFDFPSVRANLTSSISMRDNATLKIKSPSIRACVSDALVETLEYGKGLVKSVTPVRTGRLRDGWEIQDNSIANDVFYTRFVEAGTSRMAAQPMLGSSIPKIQEYWTDAVARNLKRLSS